MRIDAGGARRSLRLGHRTLDSVGHIDRDVMVHGAYTARRALEAGVLDELQLHQIPVLFGEGRKLFDVLPARIELEIVNVIDTPEATHIRYRALR